MTDVVVVGGGVAGAAAAVAAAGGRARVTLLDGGTGASTLATGALDALPWQSDARCSPAESPTDGLRTPQPDSSPHRRVMLDALGGYAVPDCGALLVTTGGIARRADGHDAALLDLRPVSGRPVGVVRCDRPGWDADMLAAAWGESFVAIDATVLRYVDERTLPDADFASRCDDEARLAWLGERLRESLARAPSSLGALVVPPSLGIDRARAPRAHAARRPALRRAHRPAGGPRGPSLRARARPSAGRGRGRPLA